MFLHSSLSVARKPWLAVTSALFFLTFSPLAHAYTQGQFEEVTTSEETQINRVREQEIQQLKIVLGRRFAENRRPDILLRLAELYTEKYRFYFFKENQIHQNMYKQGLRPKNVNHDHSREQLHGATNACLAILKSRVQYNKLDEVYYFLGYNAEEMGNKKDATKYFGVVATRYPNSAYSAEAFRNLAETAFENKKYSQALAYYERATQFTKIPSYPRTLYKLAWAYFKMRRKTDALDTMKKVIELSGKEEKFVGLRDEALGDIVMFFSEAGRFKEAHEYFSSINGGAEVYVNALTRLSGIYDRKGERQLAFKVNESLISEYGDKRPDLVYDALGKNVELYRKAGDGAGEERALNRLVDFFAAHNGEIGKGEDAQATLLRAKNYLRVRATEIHKEARKKKSVKLFGRAADLYALYIKAFLQKPSSDKDLRERAEIDGYRSDALLAAGREGDAMPQLRAMLDDDKGNPTIRRDAGATLVNLLIKRMDASKGKDASAEKQFLDVAEAFEHAFPNDKLVIELKYKRARLSAMKSGPDGLSSDARHDLEELIQLYPSRPEAAASAQDLVADLVKHKKMDDATKLAQLYLANTTLLGADKKGDLTKYLRSVIAHEDFSNVQKVELNNDFAKAAGEYERLAGSSGNDSEVVAKSLNNAAVNYDKAGMTDDAVRVYLKILAKFPANSAPREDLKRVASQLLWKSRFSEAVTLYSRLSSLDVYSHDERLSFVRTAFALAWGNGDFANAHITGSKGVRELCESGTVRKGKRRAAKSSSSSAHHASGGGSGAFADERCHDLALDLAQVEVEAGHPQEAVSQLKAYASRNTPNTRKAEANYLLGQLYQNIHEGRKASLYYEESARSVTKNSTKSRRERNFAAHSAFLLVEPYFQQFSALKIELPEERLKAVTRKKLGELDSLVTRYVNVVGYGDGEWGIAALERLSDTFTGFASELKNAPVPPRYQGAQADAYRRGIEGVVAPMSARSIDYLKQGYQKGLQLGVTTPTYMALTQRLSRRLPREYPPAHYAMVQDGQESRQSALRLAGTVQDFDATELRKPDNAWRIQVAAKLAQNSKAAESWVEFGNLEALAGRLKISRLLYEQALILNSKSPTALSNISVVLFLENRTVEATQGFSKAAEVAEFNRDIKLNLAKSQLAFHHFSPALDNLRSLGARFPQDKEVQEALAVALLGSGQLAQAATKLEESDAQGSKLFNLWYNWTVWSILAGDKGQKEKAMDMLNDRRGSLGALEKAQADLVLALGGAAK